MVCYIILSFQMRPISASSFFSLVFANFFFQIWIIGDKCYVVSFIAILFLYQFYCYTVLIQNFVVVIDAVFRGVGKGKDGGIKACQMRR